MNIQTPPSQKSLENILPTHHKVEGTIPIYDKWIYGPYERSGSYYIKTETPKNLSPLAQFLADHAKNGRRK